MALTDEQRQEAILDEVGDPSGTLAATLPIQWEKYAAYEAISPTLRDLYVKRGMLEIKLAGFDTDVDFTVDGLTAVKASQAAIAIQKKLDRAQAQIDVFEDQAQGASGAAIGTLTTVTPETPPTGPLLRPFGPDATDPQYQGNPYWPRRRALPW